jgi:hypothetical protein
MGKAFSMNGEERNVYVLLGGNRGGKRSPGRPRRK